MVLMQMLICILRSVHSGYLPKHEPFGRNIETMLIWFFVVMGDYEGKPFVISKLAAYMRMPRTTVMRKIKQLQEWKMIERRGRTGRQAHRAQNIVLREGSLLSVRSSPLAVRTRTPRFMRDDAQLLRHEFTVRRRCSV
jgi:hypothetical protein